MPSPASVLCVLAVDAPTLKSRIDRQQYDARDPVRKQRYRIEGSAFQETAEKRCAGAGRRARSGHPRYLLSKRGSARRPTCGTG